MTARPRTSDVREKVPTSVRLTVALRALGYTDEEIANKIQWDHEPALGLRRWNAEANDFDPPQNDPRYISIRLKDGHEAKTTGRKGESRFSIGDGDLQKIAKAKSLEAAQEAFEVRQANKVTGARDLIYERFTGRRGWPKRPLKSRPFPKQKKHERSGSAG